MNPYFRCFPAAVAALFITAHAGAAASPEKTPEQPPVQAAAKALDACEITGFVSKLDNVQISPWADNAPSAFATIEVRVSVEIEQRVPHGKTPTDACRLAKSGDAGKTATATYKLCSPTPLKTGDRIRATEGAMPIDPSGMSCLFDVTVLSKG